MATSYRLLLIEDDQSLAGTLLNALNKQNLYSQRVEIQTKTYEEFRQQFGLARNSTRELIVLGGKASLKYTPDAKVLKTLLTQLERTHFFLLMPPTVAGQEIFDIWQPGVTGMIERSEEAHLKLVKAIQRLQFVQQKRTYTGKSKSQSIWQRLFK